MKRIPGVVALCCFVLPALPCVAQPSATGGITGARKADVLLEVQRVSLEVFGTPADIEFPERWSAWLVRLTNRSKQPIIVQAISRTPKVWSTPRSGPDTYVKCARFTRSQLTYENWRLVDTEKRHVGRVAHAVTVLGDKRFASPEVLVFDYLLDTKSPLADPAYALQAPDEGLSAFDVEWLRSLFWTGPTVAGERRPPVVVPPAPIIDRRPYEETGPSPALWPGQNTWGWLVFYQNSQTASADVAPEPNLGSGVSWLRVINPKLLDELTDPVEEE